MSPAVPCDVFVYTRSFSPVPKSLETHGVTRQMKYVIVLRFILLLPYY